MTGPPSICTRSGTTPSMPPTPSTVSSVPPTHTRIVPGRVRGPIAVRAQATRTRPTHHPPRSGGRVHRLAVSSYHPPGTILDRHVPSVPRCSRTSADRIRGSRPASGSQLTAVSPFEGGSRPADVDAATGTASLQRGGWYRRAWRQLPADGSRRRPVAVDRCRRTVVAHWSSRGLVSSRR